MSYRSWIHKKKLLQKYSRPVAKYLTAKQKCTLVAINSPENAFPVRRDFGKMPLLRRNGSSSIHITFELFHLQMTLLTMFYKLLYRKDSFEKGTLHGEKIRLSRTEANGDDVKNHFDHCKELAVSLIDSYIVSAALEYFGMDKLDSVPTKNVILSSDESSEYEKKMSLVHSLEKFIDAYIIKDSKALLQEQTLPLQFIQIQV